MGSETQKEYYRKVLDSLGRRLFVVSPDLRILAGNRPATKQGSPDVIGKKCHEYFYGQEAPCDTCPVPEVLTSRRPIVRRMMDAESWKEQSQCLQATPIFDGEEIEAVTVLDVDLVHLHSLETELTRSNAFLRNLIMSSVDGIIASDMKGKILIFNEAASKISGYTIDEAAALAQKGLTVSKPANVSDEEWKAETAVAYPNFHSTIALDEAASKKDYAAAIKQYTQALMLYPVQAVDRGRFLLG